MVSVCPNMPHLLRLLFLICSLYSYVKEASAYVQSKNEFLSEAIVDILKETSAENLANLSAEAALERIISLRSSLINLTGYHDAPASSSQACTPGDSTCSGSHSDNKLVPAVSNRVNAKVDCLKMTSCNACLEVGCAWCISQRACRKGQYY